MNRPDRLDVVLAWSVRISFVFGIFVIGGAVGFWQGAEFVAQEATARFDCVAKP